MSYQPSSQEIEILRNEVNQRIATSDEYSDQWQRGMQEKHKRRIDEIIIDVVVSYYGRVVQEVVKQLRRLFSF